MHEGLVVASLPHDGTKSYFPHDDTRNYQVRAYVSINMIIMA